MKLIPYISIIFAGLLSMSALSAQNLPDRPVPPRLVVDYSDILSAGERNALERKLVDFNNSTSNQILLILTNDLNGMDIQSYAAGIGEQWRVGQREFDNGVVVVVKPKTRSSRGDVWISTGYGLEGAIPDITCGHIIDYEMIPHFSNNNYYGGLDAATTVLMELAAGEYTSDEYAKSQGKGLWAFLPFIIIFLIFWLINRSSRRSRTIGSHGMSPWTALLLGGMMGSAGRSGWGGSSGGSFGGGGGFGGFGGGGFGGGGAGGSW